MSSVSFVEVRDDASQTNNQLEHAGHGKVISQTNDEKYMEYNAFGVTSTDGNHALPICKRLEPRPKSTFHCIEPSFQGAIHFKLLLLYYFLSYYYLILFLLLHKGK